MILNWNFELRILSVYGQFDVQEYFQGFWLKKMHIIFSKLVRYK